MSDAVLISGFFIAAWALVCAGLGHLGGWRSLARHYAAKGPFRGRRLHFRSARFGGWVGYNGALTPGADPSGLYLAVWPLFRIGHPPLFVPWSDISLSHEKYLWIEVVLLTFVQDPRARVRITRRLAERLAAESRGSFDLTAAADHRRRDT